MQCKIATKLSKPSSWMGYSSNHFLYKQMLNEIENSKKYQKIEKYRKLEKFWKLEKIV